MTHRAPGDVSTLSAHERRFAAVAERWVRDEAGGGSPDAAAAAAAAASFTRVIIGDLKREVLAQISDDDGGASVCRCGAVASAMLRTLPPLFAPALKTLTRPPSTKT